MKMFLQENIVLVIVGVLVVYLAIIALAARLFRPNVPSIFHPSDFGDEPQ